MIDNLKIIQSRKHYRFTSDAVKLSYFAAVKAGDIVCDLCSGCGIAGINLLALNPVIKSVLLVEMQERLYDMSRRSIEYNNLGGKVAALNMRIQDIPKAYFGKFSLIICNPPYFKKDSLVKKENYDIAVCKEEITVTVSDIANIASKLLKFGGRINIIFKTDRLFELYEVFKENNIEIKRLEFIINKKGKSDLFMAEGVLKGKQGCVVHCSYADR